MNKLFCDTRPIGKTKLLIKIICSIFIGAVNNNTNQYKHCIWKTKLKSISFEIYLNLFTFGIAMLEIDAKEFQLVCKKQRIVFTHFKWHRYVNKIYFILSYRCNSITITKNFILIMVMPEFLSYHVTFNVWLAHASEILVLKKSTALVNNKFSLYLEEYQKRAIAILQTTNWANIHFIIEKEKTREKYAP